MNNTKLTVRVPRDLLENAKRYAMQHDTTLTRLVSNYLRRISTLDEVLPEAPIVRHLSGALSQEVSEADYKSYLEEKYGSPTEGAD